MRHEFPLTKANRIKLARAFKHVPRVDMSIDCVLEGQMGSARVDDEANPTALKIEIGPFFYFAGDPASPGGHAMLEEIIPYTLFMPSSPGWVEAAKKMYGDRLAGFERYSFSSAGISVEHLDRLGQASPFGEDVRQMDLAFAARMWGQDHFVDLSVFDSVEDFIQRGIGFYIERNGTIVGAAYSSLVCGRGIEVSIFVSEHHRRQGMATILASRLLQWSIENNAEANWDAANAESCKLAAKLGYVQTGTYQAHYLKKSDG